MPLIVVVPESKMGPKRYYDFGRYDRMTLQVQMPGNGCNFHPDDMYPIKIAHQRKFSCELADEFEVTAE